MNYKQKIYKNYTSKNIFKKVPKTLSFNTNRAPLYKYLIKKFFPIDKNIKIIDIGCGFGDFVWCIDNMGFKNVIGIDNSEEMINEGQRLGVNKIKKDDVFLYLKKTASNSIDLVTAIDLIEHLDKSSLFVLIEEIYRVLTVNGKVITHQPNADSPFSNSILYGDYTHEQAFTAQSIGQLFYSNKFNKIVSYEVKPIVHGIKSLIRYFLWTVIVKNIYLFLSLPETGRYNFKLILSRNFITVSTKNICNKLLIYASHPIQYHAPIFREINKSKNINLTVMFGDSIGLKEVYSPGFNANIKWDVPLTNGYQNFFLNNVATSRITKDGNSFNAVILRFFSRVNFSIFSIIKKNNFDYIMVHGYQTFTCWLILFAAKLKGIKIIFRGEAIIKENPLHVHKILSRFLIKFYLNNVDVIMYSCNGNYKYWKSFDIMDEKLFSMPCSVDNEFFNKQEKKHKPNIASIRKKLNILDEDLVIIFPSKFINRKKPIDLIKAVSKIKNKNLVLLFVGDGPEKKNMETECNKNGIKAIFTGLVNQKEISKYYIISDIIAVVSSYDASPKSLNEGLNFGLIGIVSNMVGTAGELVIDNYNGFIVEPGNIEQISNSIIKIMNDKKLKIKMKKNSKELVKKWSLKTNVDGINKSIEYLKESL